MPGPRSRSERPTRQTTLAGPLANPRFRAASLPTDLAALREISRNDALITALGGSLRHPPARRTLSRKLLTSRALAYRIQEQALGGLDRATRRRLDRSRRRNLSCWARTPSPPAPRIKPGTRLLREWQGVVHEVIVLERGVEYRGETWPSLSAVAREITGRALVGSPVLWTEGGAGWPRLSPPALRDLHPQVLRGGPRAGLQLPRCPARGLRGLHPQPGRGGMDAHPHPLRRRRLLRWHASIALRSRDSSPTSRPARSTRWWSTKSTA